MSKYVWLGAVAATAATGSFLVFCLMQVWIARLASDPDRLGDRIPSALDASDRAAGVMRWPDARTSKASTETATESQLLDGSRSSHAGP